MGTICATETCKSGPILWSIFFVVQGFLIHNNCFEFSSVLFLEFRLSLTSFTDLCTKEAALSQIPQYNIYIFCYVKFKPENTIYPIQIYLLNMSR